MPEQWSESALTFKSQDLLHIKGFETERSMAVLSNGSWGHLRHHLGFLCWLSKSQAWVPGREGGLLSRLLSHPSQQGARSLHPRDNAIAFSSLLSCPFLCPLVNEPESPWSSQNRW